MWNRTRCVAFPGQEGKSDEWQQRPEDPKSCRANLTYSRHIQIGTWLGQGFAFENKLMWKVCDGAVPKFDAAGMDKLRNGLSSWFARLAFCANERRPSWPSCLGGLWHGNSSRKHTSYIVLLSGGRHRDGLPLRRDGHCGENKRANARPAVADEREAVPLSECRVEAAGGEEQHCRSSPCRQRHSDGSNVASRTMSPSAHASQLSRPRDPGTAWNWNIDGYLHAIILRVPIGRTEIWL